MRLSNFFVLDLFKPEGLSSPAGLEAPLDRLVVEVACLAARKAALGDGARVSLPPVVVSPSESEVNCFLSGNCNDDFLYYFTSVNCHKAGQCCDCFMVNIYILVIKTNSS